MKKYIIYFLFALAIILSLTGCQDGVDIILSEAPIPTVSEPIPEETIISTSSTVTDGTVYTETDITSVVTSSIPVTTVITPRPSIEWELERYAIAGADISFEPIEATEETVLAKNFERTIWEAVDRSIEDAFWNAVIDLDKYIDDGYLKDYIEFQLDVWSRDGIDTRITLSNYDIPLIEAVEQKQTGDITYIKVKRLVQYYTHDEWCGSLGTNWVGIRNGRVVDYDIFSECVYEFIGIEKDENNKYGDLRYPFPPERNPWDNIEDIKKIYDGLKAKGYDIEMKEYPQPNSSTM